MAPAKKKPITRDAIQEAVRLHDLAVQYRAEGNHDKAKPASLRSLRILEKAVGPNHPDVANVLNTLASTYEDLDQYEEAEKLCLRSVQIMETIAGDPALDDDIARIQVQSLGSLAGVYRAQGRYDK